MKIKITHIAITLALMLSSFCIGQQKHKFNHNKLEHALQNTIIKAPLTDKEIAEYLKYAHWSHISWAKKQATNPQRGMGTPLFHENWMRIYDEAIKSLEK